MPEEPTDSPSWDRSPLHLRLDELDRKSDGVIEMAFLKVMDTKEYDHPRGKDSCPPCSVHAIFTELIETARKNADELVAARETIRKLNRRAQEAESGVRERLKNYVPGKSGPGLGRRLAGAAGAMYKRERDELRVAMAEVANILSRPGGIEQARALVAKTLEKYRGEPIGD